jgi:predicted SAM-dependent methyltransferase
MKQLARDLYSVVRRHLGKSSGPPMPVAPLAPVFEPGASHASTFRTRDVVAAVYLRGHGIEVGAAHQALHVPETAHVTYVDRMSAEDLRRTYPELGDMPLADVAIIENGETLATVGDNTQDFVIANHFIEHCENPILTLQTLFRVTKTGGVVFMAVPDKRYTFDVDRPCTSLDHVSRDFSEGPAWSKRQHFEEWSRLVSKTAPEAAVQQEVAHLLNIGYSIHYHVWGATELLEFLADLRRHIQFELELFLRNGFENVLVFRK